MKMKDNMENMENGRLEKAELEREEIIELRRVWLDHKGFTESDVLVGEEGEYVVEYIEMDEGENGDYTRKVTMLPPELQL